MPHLRDEAWSNPADASWSFPLVGAALGAFAGLIGSALLCAGLTPEIAAAFAVLTLLLLTGAMHEDGLTDCADGLGARSSADRLAIMKDSQIGCYGAVALGISLLLRWVLLAYLAQEHLFSALVAAGALSRAPIAALAYALPNARQIGLSKGFGTPSDATMFASSILGFLIAAIWLGLPAVGALIAVAITMLLLGRLAMRLIGGRTGDVFGAAQQTAEISALLAIAILV